MKRRRGPAALCCRGTCRIADLAVVTGARAAAFAHRPYEASAREFVLQMCPERRPRRPGRSGRRPQLLPRRQADALVPAAASPAAPAAPGSPRRWRPSAAPGASPAGRSPPSPRARHGTAHGPAQRRAHRPRAGAARAGRPRGSCGNGRRVEIFSRQVHAGRDPASSRTSRRILVNCNARPDAHAHAVRCGEASPNAPHRQPPDGRRDAGRNRGPAWQDRVPRSGVSASICMPSITARKSSWRNA